MLADKLFERFPCDEVYGLHNAPQLNPARSRSFPARRWRAPISSTSASRAAAATAPGRKARDPIVIASALVQALQSIVSRNADPLKAVVLSVTQIHSGSAYNIIPEEATLCGTMRAFSDELREMVRGRMRAIVAGIAAAFEVEIDIDMRNIFSVLENHEAQPRLAEAIPASSATENVLTRRAPSWAARISPTCCMPCPAPIAGSAMRATCRCTIPASSSTTASCRSAPAFSPASSKPVSRQAPMHKPASQHAVTSLHDLSAVDLIAGFLAGSFRRRKCWKTC